MWYFIFCFGYCLKWTLFQVIWDEIFTIFHSDHRSFVKKTLFFLQSALFGKIYALHAQYFLVFFAFSMHILRTFMYFVSVNFFSKILESIFSFILQPLFLFWLHFFFCLSFISPLKLCKQGKSHLFDKQYLLLVQT